MAGFSDRTEKLALFRESLGGQVDEDVARDLLEAHGWNLELALNTMLGGGDFPTAQSAPPPSNYGAGYGAVSDEPREAMRTGYTDTLMAPMSAQEQMRIENERREREQERERQMEERRQAQELQRKKDLERRCQDQRKEAERQALERRKAKQEAEAAAWRQSRGEVVTTAAPAATGQAPVQAAAPQAPMPQATAPAAAATAAAASARAAPTLPVAAPAVQAPAAAPAAAAASSASEVVTLAEPEASRPAPPAAKQPKEADAVAQALGALRRRYREVDPDGLKKCVQTLKVYISNLANAPHEPKFQRINCENNAFQQRVGAFEGAICVLEACGFVMEGGTLVVGPDFLKSKGPKLWDALSKINVILDQLQ